jgi:hypothetical protein
MNAVQGDLVYLYVQVRVKRFPNRCYGNDTAIIFHVYDYAPINFHFKIGRICLEKNGSM